jgi:hypothetical protein
LTGVTVDDRLHRELDDDEGAGDGEREDDAPAARRGSDELPDEEPKEDEREDEHDPVEVPVEADQVEPGDVRVRNGAPGTAPDLRVDRRARPVEDMKTRP